MLFLIVAIGIMAASFYRNISLQTSFSLGKSKTIFPLTTVVYIIAGFAVVLWTLIIDRMCKLGYTQLSWGCFLVPTVGVASVLLVLNLLHGFNVSMKINEGIELGMNIFSK
jgi:hypothetical protein